MWIPVFLRQFCNLQNQSMVGSINFCFNSLYPKNLIIYINIFECAIDFDKLKSNALMLLYFWNYYTVIMSFIKGHLDWTEGQVFSMCNVDDGIQLNIQSTSVPSSRDL